MPRDTCMRCAGEVALLTGSVRHVFPPGEFGGVDYERDSDHAPELVKRCACGAAFDWTSWRGLRLVGYGEIPAEAEDDMPEIHEYRDCARCRSTITVRVHAEDVVTGAKYAALRERDETLADLMAAGIVGPEDSPVDGFVRLLARCQHEPVVREELGRLLALSLDERHPPELRADAAEVVRRVEAGRAQRPHDSPVWHEPSGGMLDEGWYANGPHGARLGPFDTSEIAWQQLRRARGW